MYCFYVYLNKKLLNYNIKNYTNSKVKYILVMRIWRHNAKYNFIGNKNIVFM